MLDIYFNVKYTPVIIWPLLPFPTQTRLKSRQDKQPYVKTDPTESASIFSLRKQQFNTRYWQVPLLPKDETDERPEQGRQGIRACSASGHLCVKF